MQMDNLKNAKPVTQQLKDDDVSPLSQEMNTLQQPNVVTTQSTVETEQKLEVEPAQPFAIDTDEWTMVGTSVIGKGHISAKIPCQDYCKYESLGKGWGIAIVSDGAGSAEFSHFGSKIIVEKGIIRFKELIEKEGWLKNNELPDDAKWQQVTYSTLKAIRDDMEMFAKTKKISLKSLNATVIVLIHSPLGILATHVGDGRSGYKNKNGEWEALIKPHKGEEANQTIFLPSDFWDISQFQISGVSVPENIIIREQVLAFTLMSDGCENTAWQYYQKNEETGKFYDPNKPHPPFFEPLCETLQSFHNDKVDLKERKEKWNKFLTDGTKSFENETDDKTMILGVLISKT